MSNSEATRKLAVLIDADNASPKIADGLFDEVAKIGEASLRRAYGDFSGTGASGWNKDVLRDHAIQAYHQYPYTKQKNATDIAMVIDAMDMLHSGRFDGFCIVSSDSDFTALASRIREEGVEVIGIGRSNAPQSFKKACTRFIITENFARSEETDTGAKEKPSNRKKPDQAVPLLRKAVAELEGDADGWYRLGTVGNRLSNLSSEFDTRTYGHEKLSDLVEATSHFEIDRKGPSGPRMRVKLTRRKKNQP